MTMKRMLETSFPGIHVILHNYPPPFPKRVLSKVIPIVQVGAVATIMAGDQIFPRLGMVPPPWYYSLRTNRFGTMATIWLLGNFAQSFLQSSGAFEVYCNGELVCLLFSFLLTYGLHFCSLCDDFFYLHQIKIYSGFSCFLLFMYAKGRVLKL
jgi:selT/selW/selH-like putative selenoprotein